MLLPIAPDLSRRISLDNHIALEVLRSGAAEMYHLGSMAQATYLTWSLCEAGYGIARDGLFREMDETIARCRGAVLDSGVWRIDDHAYALLCEVLTLHDRQLATASVSELMLANDRLKKLSAEG